MTPLSPLTERGIIAVTSAIKDKEAHNRKDFKKHRENFKYSNGRFFNVFVHVGLLLNIVFVIWLTYLIIFG
tara:strand:- start:59 stop:271 length:213 start_codon:yes stop_codon:yes gene_type:complete